MKVLIRAVAISVMFGAGLQAATFSGKAVGSWVETFGTNADGENFEPDGTKVPVVGATVTNDDTAGSASIEWGTPVDGSFSNLWTFDGIGSGGVRSWSADIGEVFKFGEFTYRNGSVSGSNFSAADLQVALNFDDPSIPTTAFQYGFDVFNTPNERDAQGNLVDPAAAADRALIFGETKPNSFVFNGRQYKLELVGFSQDSGATTVDEFVSPEDTTAFASLYGKFVAVGPTPVPVPASMVLLLGGLGAMAVVGRRKKRRA